MGPRLSKNLQSRFQPPSLAHHVGAQEQIAVALDGFLQQQLLAVKLDVAQAFVGRGERAVGGLGGGGEPALVDAAAMSAEDVEIARIEFQAPAGHQERARHPAGREAHDAFSGGQGLADESRGGCEFDHGTRMKTGVLKLRGHVGL